MTPLINLNNFIENEPVVKFRFVKIPSFVYLEDGFIHRTPIVSITNPTILIPKAFAESNVLKQLGVIENEQSF